MLQISVYQICIQQLHWICLLLLTVSGSLETFFIVTTWWKVLLASSGLRSGMLLNTLKCMGQSPQQSIIPSSITPRLRNAPSNVCILEVDGARVPAMTPHKRIFHYNQAAVEILYSLFYESASLKKYLIFLLPASSLCFYFWGMRLGEFMWTELLNLWSHDTVSKPC